MHCLGSQIDYFAIYLHGSLTTGYASMDPKDIVIMRLTCITSAIGTLKCPGPEVIKHICSAQLRLKFILLINIKRPTIVGTDFCGLNLEIQFIWAILAFMSSLNFMLS